MIIFLDTETTGLADFNKRARDPSQPHIVQIAILRCNDDGSELSSFDTIIKPDGWTIPKEASAVHGITTQQALEVGIPEEEAAATLLADMRNASLLIGHNIQFDKFIGRIAMRRHDLMTDADDQWWKQYPTFCTMRAMTPICKLPGPYGWKWPSMKEAHAHCFGKPHDGAHGAMTDVSACRRVYLWLKDHEAKKKLQTQTT